jgi:hypothetical protein
MIESLDAAIRAETTGNTQELTTRLREYGGLAQEFEGVAASARSHALKEIGGIA